MQVAAIISALQSWYFNFTFYYKIRGRWVGVEEGSTLRRFRNRVFRKAERVLLVSLYWMGPVKSVDGRAIEAIIMIATDEDFL